MNQNSIEFIKSTISHTINKVYSHVSRLDASNDEKATIAFRLYEAHAGAIVAHMIDAFIEEEHYDKTVDEVTSTMNSYIKSFIAQQQQKKLEQMEH